MNIFSFLIGKLFLDIWINHDMLDIPSDMVLRLRAVLKQPTISSPFIKGGWNFSRNLKDEN